MGSLTPIPDVFVAMDDETQAQTVPSGFVVVLAPTAAILMDAPAGPPGKQGLQGIPGQAGFSFISVIAGEPSNAHRFYLTDSVGTAFPASCNDLSHCGRVLGMALSAAQIGGQFDLQCAGEITEPTWSWDVTLPIFLGADGFPTQIVPIGAVFSQIVATVISPTRLNLSIQPPVILA